MFRTKMSLFCLSVNPYTIQKDHAIILSLLIHHFVGLCRLWFLPGHLHYQVETPKKPCFLFAALSTLLLMSAASASYSFFFEAKCAHQLVRVLIESLQSFCLSLSLHVPDKSAAAAALCVTGKSLGRINMLSSSSKLQQGKDHISTRLQDKSLLRKLQFKISCDLKLKCLEKDSCLWWQKDSKVVPKLRWLSS
ncbi:unnamed protein product [Musa acuminata var. zebrina]